MSEMTISSKIDYYIKAIGHCLSWLALFLVAIVCLSVFLRYALGISSLAFDELQWHVYSFCFLMGFSYATAEKSHVRNDILFNKFSKINQLRIDLFSHVVVLLPFIGVILYLSWFFVMRAYQTGEGSIDPGGLQYRWIIKSALLLAFFLFGVAAISRSIEISRKISLLKRDIS